MTEPRPTIQPLTTDILEDNEKFLLYGEPGMGKTFCALTLPEPIFFLAIGGPNEAKTYFSKDFQDKYGKKEIHIGVAQEKTGKMGRVDTPEGFDNACRLLDDAFEMDAKGQMQFNSIIIDNATVLSEYQMYKAVYWDYGQKDPKKQDDTTYTKYIEEGLLFPYDRDWGSTQSIMRKFVSWLFRMEKHIAFIAHEHKTEVKDRKSQTSTTTALKPLFIGKDRDQVANAFDNVWQFSRNGQQYVARTTAQGQNPRIIAKSRIGGLIRDNYANPDLSEAIKKYKEHAMKRVKNQTTPTK